MDHFVIAVLGLTYMYKQEERGTNAKKRDVGHKRQKLELTSGSYTTKEKVADKQQGSWTTRIFKGDVASKEKAGSCKEEKKTGKGSGKELSKNCID